MAPPEFTFLGDAVWLDFVNSARGREPDPPDLLPDAPAFERWAGALHLENDGKERSFSAVRRFRDQLTELAEALHHGLQLPAASIEAVNDVLSRTPGNHQLTRINGEWRLRFAPARMLTAIETIARSAAATLADPQVIVRRCAGQNCSLFFTDASPNQSRLWCSPAFCGWHARIERRRGLLR
ncbi:MAG TPA: CGNR zinc finger domain-containing protein [Gemmatimonadales bacterium]|jgi:predicted RNA-binding Zn ribbon-like protein